MSITNYPQNYHDEFDSTKNYNKVLFIAGNGLQSRELNEIQDWSSFQLGQMMRKLLTDGTIVSGGTILSYSNLIIGLDQGYIYAAGVVTFVNAINITITGTGTEIIGMARQDLLYTDSHLLPIELIFYKLIRSLPPSMSCQIVDVFNE